MTLLDEYQALPGEPAHPDFNRQRVLRRDAIVRLLCRALGHAASDLERMEVATHDLRALLTAVDRDFPEGA